LEFLIEVIGIDVFMPFAVRPVGQNIGKMTNPPTPRIGIVGFFTESA
jgi:hypothetical protein